MDILINPNVAYLLLVVGSLLLLMAIVTPGTHLLEGGALLLLALAGYDIYRLGALNWWAPALLVVSIVPYVHAIQKPKRELFLVLSLLGFIVGSVYLFPSKGFIPAVNPFLAVILSPLSAGFLWFVVHKSLQAYNTRPVHDLETLIGKTGLAKTRIEEDGAVQVAGELWSARSDKPIPEGSRVRVLKREGFSLVVEREDRPSR